MKNEKSKKDKKPKKLNPAQRQGKISELTLIGLTRYEIYDFCKKNGFRMSHKKIDAAIETAVQSITGQADPDPVYSLGESFARLRDLYKNSYAIQDFKTCAHIQKEINHLLLVNGITGMALPGIGDDLLESDPNEIFRIIEQKFSHLAPTPETDTLELIQIAARKIQGIPLTQQ